jgi:hypothetical protein
MMASLSSVADSFLSDAGWLFFAGWTAVVAAVSITAFHNDLFPSREHQVSATKREEPH